MTNQLTDKEKIVLTLLGQGETGTKICKVMGISEQEFKQIKISFNTKLGARNYIHALYLALSQGLLKL